MTQFSYQCAACGGTFVSDWTDEEAKDELKQRFGKIPPAECDILCDDCYKVVMAGHGADADQSGRSGS